MRVLRAAGVWVGIALLTVGFGLPAILAAFVPPRGDWFLRFARGWARSLLAVGGVSVEVRGSEQTVPGESYVVVANHESYADIAVLLAKLPVPARFMAKRSIFRVPVLGWSIAAAGFIPVDRGDRSRAPATLETARRRLAGGRSVVVFPEETRSGSGELLPFKRGAAILARRSGLRLVPVGIAGTRAVLPRGSLVVRPGHVAVCFGEPIAPTGDESGRDLTRRLREEVARLRAEAASQIDGSRQ